MKLNPEEILLFVKNWLGLLAFVNDKHKIVSGFGHPKKLFDVKPEAVIKIKKKLWKNNNMIDEYINSKKRISETDFQLLNSWKKRLFKEFILLKFQKNYTVFLDEKKNILYGVIGITNPLSDVIDKTCLPMIIETTLMPFKDRIIYDSTISGYNVTFGSNIRKHYKELYSEIKAEKGIICSL